MLENLNQFTGSMEFYRHWTNKIIFTEGMKYFADQIGGYWLIDHIAIFYSEIPDDFIAINFKVKDNKAEIIAGDGNDNVYQKHQIEFTDAPNGEWTFYLELNELGSHTLLLPSEH